MKQIEELKSQEDTIRKGLNMFKIEQQPSKALQGLEKDVRNLQSVSVSSISILLQWCLSSCPARSLLLISLW